MSDESRRIGLITGGNANLLTILGDLLSSDGQQTMRVPLGLPGQVLTVDLTAECGIAWAAAGGGGALTASDGVTRTLDNLTNDLVTGVQVADVDMDSAGDIVGEAAGGVLFRAAGAGSAAQLLGTGTANVVINTQGGDVEISSDAANVDITSDLDMQLVSTQGNLTLQATAGNLSLIGTGVGTTLSISTANVANAEINVAAGSNLILTAGSGPADTGAITMIADEDITASATDDIVLTSGDDIILAFDELVYQAPGANNVVLTASAAGDYALATIGEGPFIQRSAAGTLTLEGAVAQRLILASDATRLLAFYGHVTGAAQAAAIADAAGGGVIDAEARTALNALLAAVRAVGLIDT